jgi:hypothetical protein
MVKIRTAPNKAVKLIGAALIFCLFGIFYPCFARATGSPPKLTPIGNKTAYVNIPVEFDISAADPDNEKLQYYVYLAGDLNHDNLLTPLDSLRLNNTLNTYGTAIKPGRPGWNPEMDLNNDKIISPLDSMKLTNLINSGKTNMPQGIALDVNTGHFKWTPLKQYTGANTLTFAASDGSLRDAEVVVITVKNEPPPLSISINPKLWNIGQTEVNKTVTMKPQNKIMVTNNSPVTETFLLSLVNPAGWTAANTPGKNTYVVSGLFCDPFFVPSENNFNKDSTAYEDVIATMPKKATTTVFGSNNSSTNGSSVPAGQARALYLQFKSPIITDKTNEQNISVIVSCQTP